MVQTHSFEVKVAQLYGINQAIILSHLYYWFARNRANDRNYFDGTYWTYNSLSSYTELFPYFTLKQIRLIFEKLEEQGLVISAVYGDNPFDRTKWYTLTEKALETLGEPISPKGQFEETERANVQTPKRANVQTPKRANVYTSNKPNSEPGKEHTSAQFQSSLFGDELEDKKSKETLFRNSELYEERADPISPKYDITAGVPIWESKFPREYQDIDLVYYYNAVLSWSEKKEKIKRTTRGWVATGRDFMKSDRDKGVLKMRTTPTNQGVFAQALNNLSDFDL